MPIVSGSVPNLINGVSQQPFALRLASQAEEQINGYSSIVEGLTKRAPSKHVAKLMSSLPDASFVHIINRDVGERYVVVATNGDLKVFDFAGAEKTVHFPAGKSYLGSANCNFSAVTVADYTFFLNKDATVQWSGEVRGGRGPEAMVYVRQGNYATRYQVVVNGSGTEKITSSTDPNDIQTGVIAQALGTQIASLGFGVGLYNSTIHVVNPTPFSITCNDSLGDTALVCVTRQAQTFSALPARAAAGYQVEITGAPGNAFDNYWLEYDNTGAGGQNGVWREIAAPGRNIAFSGTTMPHTLVRNPDGTFTFGPASWAKCAAGSEITCPSPSFVGKRISDIFFYRNRLGFIADENVIFSRSSEHFNFWRETATQLLDTDPIDIASSHVKVSILRHAVPFNESLLLFSDQTQFLLGAGEALTPSGVSLDQVTEFETSPLVRPVGAGAFIYFCTPKGDYTGVREYYLDGVSKTNNANDVTSHVPRYIPGGVFKLSASTNEDILIALSTKSRNSIYVYKYYYSAQEKVQSSWSRWAMADGDVILNAEFIENTLWLVVKRADGVFLERLNIETGVSDDGLPMVIHLDRRITQAQAVGRTFNGSHTTFSLPYALPDPTSLVIVAGPGVPGFAPGRRVPYTLVGGAYRVKGNLSAFYAGINYTLRYRLSPLLIREQAAGGGQIANTEGRIQLRRGLVNYADSGYFRIEVTPERRQTYTSTFTGRIIGSGRNVLGRPVTETGSFPFAIMANNMAVKIEFVNDTHFPSRHLNIDWEAFYTVRTQRLS
jgi:hypothetical protein